MCCDSRKATAVNQSTTTMPLLSLLSWQPSTEDQEPSAIHTRVDKACHIPNTASSVSVRSLYDSRTLHTTDMTALHRNFSEPR